MVSVDLSNALAIVLTAAATGVAGLLTAALTKLRAKWGLESTAQDKRNMEEDIKAALMFGVAQVLPLIAQQGWDHVNTTDAILNNAVEYFKQRFPDRTATIAEAAHAPIAQGVGTAVRDTLSARLPEVVEKIAYSPVVSPSATKDVPK